MEPVLLLYYFNWGDVADRRNVANRKDVANWGDVARTLGNS